MAMRHPRFGRRFAPTLAYKAKPRLPLDLEALFAAGPMAGSYKYDGYRAVTPKGRLMSRNLLPIPNVALRNWIEDMDLPLLDGELIYGDPTAPDCFKLTSSAVTTRDAPRDGIRFVVFDTFDPLYPRASFRERNAALRMMSLPRGLTVVRHELLQSARQALEFEEEALRLGYEGIMLRSIDGQYKFGRSTLRERILVAVKRHESFEAEILDVLPRYHNQNAQERDELGRAKRSKRRNGMVPMASVGRFLVRELKAPRRTMECGTGTFTMEECARLWKMRAALRGKVLNCRRQPDATGKRFPRAHGFRSRIDF